MSTQTTNSVDKKEITTSEPLAIPTQTKNMEEDTTSIKPSPSVSEAGQEIELRTGAAAAQIKPIEFTRFPDLPTELRLRIWRHAMPGPRYLEVGFAAIPQMPSESPNDYANTNMYSAFDTSHIHCNNAVALSSTCHESRDEFRRHYFRLGGSWQDTTGAGRQPPYFNPDIDTIVLCAQGDWQCVPGTFDFVRAWAGGEEADARRLGGRMIRRLGIHRVLAHQLFLTGEDASEGCMENLRGLEEILLYDKTVWSARVLGYEVLARMSREEVLAASDDLGWRFEHKIDYKLTWLEDQVEAAGIYMEGAKPVVRPVRLLRA